MNEPNSKEARKFIWFPTWHELRTHYFKELGFLACLSQMIGATVFWIAGFTALPPIFNRLTSTAAQNGAYWLPQVIGGTGFIVSGTFFMLETQRKWYIPAPKVLGWHIAVWNLIGVCFPPVIRGRTLLTANRESASRSAVLWGLLAPIVELCMRRALVRSQDHISYLHPSSFIFPSPRMKQLITNCSQSHLLGFLVFLDWECHSVV
jgi:hypothetical protein